MLPDEGIYFAPAIEEVVQYARASKKDPLECVLDLWCQLPMSRSDRDKLAQSHLAELARHALAPARSLRGRESVPAPTVHVQPQEVRYKVKEKVLTWVVTRFVNSRYVVEDGEKALIEFSPRDHEYLAKKFEHQAGSLQRMAAVNRHAARLLESRKLSVTRELPRKDLEDLSQRWHDASCTHPALQIPQEPTETKVHRRPKARVKVKAQKK